MRGTAMLMKRSRNSYIRAPRSVTAQPIACPSRRLKFAIAFLARVTTGRWPVIAASSATAAWPGGRGCPGCPGPRSLSGPPSLSHPRDRLTRLDGHALDGAVLVAAAAHPRGLARFRVEQHHVRRGDRRRELDDPALRLGGGGALVLLHDVHALDHDPELLGVHVQDLALAPAVVAADHAHPVALGDVELVARRLSLAAPSPSALLEDERLHFRSPPARATRSS